MCMGCGVSRFDHEEAGPPFNRPMKRDVFNSKIENDSTLMLNQPLHGYGSKAESFPDRSNNNQGTNVSSWAGCKSESDVRDQVNAKNTGGGMSAVRGDNSISQRKKNEEENESFSDREDGISCPGSPSFREYAVSVESRNDINKGIKGGKGKTNEAQAKRYLNNEMAKGSEAGPRKRRSSGRGLIKSAMQRPAGWLQRQK